MLVALAACIPLVYWNGDPYVGQRDTVKLGAALKEQAIVPACNDTSQNEPDTKTTVKRVRGIDPHFAVAAGGMLFVNNATFPALKSHPLHKRLKYPDKPPQRQGEACSFSGVANPGGGLLTVKVGGRPRYIQVAIDTAITVRRHGTAYIPKGTKVHVTGLCRGPQVAATRITAAADGR